MDLPHMMFGEKSITKVAGLFVQRVHAEVAAAHLAGVSGLEPGQVRLLGPQDAKAAHRNLFGRKLEPEQRGMFKTMLRAHFVTALIGIVVGVVLFFLLSRNVAMVAQSPVLAFIAIVWVCFLAALIVGGLITLRPDHVALISAVRRALRHNRWAVVVHPINPEQIEAAKTALQGAGAEVLSSL